ncbi:hypothetical protein AHAS_Ahas15G0264300 [Arachis hypogaea]
MCCREKEMKKTPTVKRKQLKKGAKKQSKSSKLVLTDSESKTESKRDERVRVSIAKRRREALQLLKEKRAKRRNDGAQTTNVAPDRFDSTEAQNDLSEILPTVKLGSKPLLQTQTSSTPSVNFPINTSTRPDPDLQIIEVREETRSQPLDMLVFQCAYFGFSEELIKDHFTYVPFEIQTQETSVNDSPPESQQQPCEEAPARQSEQEAPVDVCPQEPKNQASEESFPTETELEPPLNVCTPEPEKQAARGIFPNEDGARTSVEYCCSSFFVRT